MALHQYQKDMYKKIGVIVALVILPIAGFFTGMQYQKQTSTAVTNGASKFANGARGMRNRAIGTVKSVSATSITVTEQFNNTDKTYTLTTSTTYRNGAADAQASDVQAGDTVLLTLDTSDTSKVTAVTLNPTMMFRGSTAPNTSDTGNGGAALQ